MRDEKPKGCPVRDQDVLLRREDIAYLLRTSPNIATKLISSGDFLPPLMIGPLERWRLEDVQAWLRTTAMRVHAITDVAKSEAVLAKNIPPSLGDIADKLHEYGETMFPPCVYFLMHEGRIIYVGQTVKLPLRIYQHRRGEGRFPAKVFDRVLYLHVVPARLLSAEKYFIDLLQPELNRTGVYCDDE